MTLEAITRRSLFYYALLAMPVAFAGYPLYVLAPDYYTTHHGLSLTTLGIALLCLRLGDALQDPLIGRFSDHHRRGIPWIMTIAAILLCTSIYGLFNQLWFSPLVWFISCMAIAVTAYSVLTINLAALGALWGGGLSQQLRIASFREAFAIIGVLVAVSLPALPGSIIGVTERYHWFALFLGLLMALALVLFQRWYSLHQTMLNPQQQPLSFIQQLKQLPTSTRYFLMVYGVSMLASSIPAVLVLFFIRDRLGATPYTGLFIGLYFISAAFSMALWKHISLRYGNYRTWLIAMLIATLSFIWAFFLQQGDSWQYGLICIVSGIALGAELVIPPVILANDLHHHHITGAASTYYALLVLLSKASLAIASVLVLPILDSAGFIPQAQNSETALLALSITYALLPCALKLCAAMLLIHVYKGVSHENIKTNLPTRSFHHV